MNLRKMLTEGSAIEPRERFQRTMRPDKGRHFRMIKRVRVHETVPWKDEGEINGGEEKDEHPEKIVPYYKTSHPGNFRGVTCSLRNERLLI